MTFLFPLCYDLLLQMMHSSAQHNVILQFTYTGHMGLRQWKLKGEQFVLPRNVYGHGTNTTGSYYISMNAWPSA